MLTGALGTSGLVGATRNRQSIDSLEISGKSKTQGNSLGNTYLRKPPALAVQNGVEIKSPDIYGNYLTLKGGAYGGGDIPTMRIKSTGIVLGDAGNGCHIASNGQNADYGNMSFGYNGSIGSSVIAGFTVRGWCFLGATLPVYIGSTSVVNPNGVSLYAPSNYVLEQRFGTNAQTLRVFNTYTSSTSFETYQVKCNSTQIEISSAIGSAGGTARPLQFGHTNAAGTFTNCLSVSILGNTLVPQGKIVGFSSSTGSGIQFNNGNLVVGGFASESIGTAGVWMFSTTAGGGTGLFLTPGACSGQSGITHFTLTPGADTNNGASVEATDVNFNLARTVQFATGALTTQRAMRIQAPTYSFVGASTITTASTLSISGAPVAGTNATITNKYALAIENNGILQLQNVNGYESGVPRILISLGTPYVGLGNASFVVNGDGYCYSYAGFEAASTSSIGFQGDRLTLQGGWGGIYRNYGSMNGNGNAFTSAYGIALVAGTYGVQLISGTTANKLQVYTTFTSSTSYETINIKGKASANFEIGPENGSAGGTLRGLTIGGYSAGSTTITPWLTFTSSGTPTVNVGTLVIPSGGTGLLCQQTNIYLDSYGTHSGIRYRRSEGTQGSPTGVALNSLLGFVATYGYHTGSAYHSTQGASISFYATEAFTSGAQGSKIVFGTTPNGTTTNTVALTIDQNQVATFSKLVAQSAAEITSTPSGTTQTITLNNGNHQTLTLTSATGAVTATLTVPSNVSSGTIIVKQHASVVRNITWAVSAGTIKWMGTEPDWAADAVNDIRIVSWRYDGSVMYLMSTDKAA